MSTLKERIQQEFDRLNDTERCYNEIKDVINRLYRTSEYPSLDGRVDIAMSHRAMVEYIEELHRRAQRSQKPEPYLVERIHPTSGKITHSFDSAESLVEFLQTKEGKSTEQITKLLHKLDNVGQVDTMFARYKHATEN